MTHRTLRPAIWHAVRKLSKAGSDITTARVRAYMVAPPPHTLDAVRDYLKALAAARILEPIDPAVPGVWRLLRDEGVEAPRVRPDGTRVTMGSGREAMWRIMRILTRPWTLDELVAHASTETHPVRWKEAEDYATRLYRAGYLQRTAVGTYRLIPSRWTGPASPKIRRTKEVWDPNLGGPAPWNLPDGGAA